MPPGTELSRNLKLNAIVFGRYKMGKTEGASTFPRPNFICCDPGGLDTVLSPGFRQRHPEVDLSKLHYEYFLETQRDARGVNTNHEAFDSAYRYFDTCMKGGEWKSPTTGRTYKIGPDDFDTWVLDSATTLFMHARNKAVQLLGDPSFAGKALSNTFKAAQAKGLIVPKMQDFGAERSLVEQFISALLTSGKHVLVLAHEREWTEQDGTVSEITPMFTGQSVEVIPLMFSNVMRLMGRPQGDKFIRYLESKKHSKAQVGSRLEIPDGTEWNWQAIQASLKTVSG